MVNYLIVGGGIAGVECARYLSAKLIHERGSNVVSEPTDRVLLLTATPLMKTVKNVSQLSKNLERFDVVEAPISAFSSSAADFDCRFDVEVATVSAVDATEHTVTALDGRKWKYDFLCITTGAKPRLLYPNDRVLGIRDTQSVQELRHALQSARRVVLIGNGGIALECAFELPLVAPDVEIVWSVREDHIGSTFLDSEAAKYMLAKAKCKIVQQEPLLTANEDDDPLPEPQDTVYQQHQLQRPSASAMGSALGPDWIRTLRAFEPPSHSSVGLSTYILDHLTIEYQTECDAILSMDRDQTFPIKVVLSNGKSHFCDFVVSATGVTPSTDFLGSEFERARDGGLVVNQFMQTSVASVFAAGDACTITWDQSPHWFQMRLWSQARLTGRYAAHCMLGHRSQLGFNFDIFAHSTTFFGCPVVLLGLYNGQSLGDDYEVLIRGDDEKTEYVKVVLKDGRVQGAMLIGDTGLEETMENLILSGLDVSHLRDNLLNPAFQVDDYFD